MIKRLAAIAASLLLASTFAVPAGAATFASKRDSGWGCGGPC